MSYFHFSNCKSIMVFIFTFFFLNSFQMNFFMELEKPHKISRAVYYAKLGTNQVCFH